METPGRTVIERIEEAMREIGVLIVALTPLDAAFTSQATYSRARVVALLAAGVLLFIIALVMERRRIRG